MVVVVGVVAEVFREKHIDLCGRWTGVARRRRRRGEYCAPCGRVNRHPYLTTVAEWGGGAMLIMEVGRLEFVGERCSSSAYTTRPSCYGRRSGGFRRRCGSDKETIHKFCTHHHHHTNTTATTTDHRESHHCEGVKRGAGWPFGSTPKSAVKTNNYLLSPLISKTYLKWFFTLSRTLLTTRLSCVFRKEKKENLYINCIVVTRVEE